MAFTIPNEADAFNATQAKFFKVDLDILVAGAKGDGIVIGGDVTAQGTPDMTLAVAAGLLCYNNTTAIITAGNVTITTAHATNPRIDLVVVSNTGTKSVTAGTAAATPVMPSIPANSLVLAAVYVPANDTAIQSNQIIDKRVLVPGDVWIRKPADETVNNSNTLQDDDDFKWGADANSTWEFETVFQGSATGTAADWKFGWSLPAGTTMAWGPHVNSTTSYFNPVTSGNAPTAPAIESTVIACGSANLTSAFLMRGIIRVGSTAGTIQFQWAQNTATVADSKLLANSYIHARRIT